MVRPVMWTLGDGESGEFSGQLGGIHEVFKQGEPGSAEHWEQWGSAWSTLRQENVHGGGAGDGTVAEGGCKRLVLTRADR